MFIVQFDPVAFSLGPIKVRWYGLMYLFGFLTAWVLALWRAKRYQLAWSKQEISDLIFYAATGVLLGGRIGYMLFYNTSSFLSEPWIIFKIWEGGMSFHGGSLGVLFACLYFGHKTQKSFLGICDFVAPLIPLGLLAGRLGNFINGELWGRTTMVSWGMIFPRADWFVRHPSPLYELFLEGMLLFIVIWIYAAKPRKEGRVAALFLISYAVVRILAECFREPDLQLGFIAFHWLTMGQLLSIPMLLMGIAVWGWKR